MKNGIPKSRIEVYLGVIRNLLDDLRTELEASNLRVRCKLNLAREIERDLAYIETRSRSEGLPFLTVVLPSLGKWYDRWLAGQDPGVPLRAFLPHEARGNTTYPCPVFARMLAYVLSDESSDPVAVARVVRLWRTLFYLFYKMEVPHSEEQLSAALAKWKAVETELLLWETPNYYDEDIISLRSLVTGLIGTDSSLFTEIRPAHGPGAVAGREKGDEKWLKPTYIPSLNRVYPQYEMYFGLRTGHGLSDYAKDALLEWKKSRLVDDGPTARLTFVPKDSRGPRTICMEPKELMFVQQGVMENLMRLLPISSNHRINFRDQSINANLALSSSKDGEYATVDLEDASDRVSWRLVQQIFPEGSLRYLAALRSTQVILPDKTIWSNLQKFAPMGSALCFPVECIVFWAIGVLAGIKSGMDVASAKRDTYVFGDDIVIRPQAVPALQELLSRYSLKMNPDKTYVSGPFRESCGMDALNGHCVTPFKVRMDIGRRSLNAVQALAVCKMASECLELYWFKTGLYLRELVQSQYGFIPVTTEPKSYLSVVSPSYLYYSDEEWSRSWRYNACCIGVEAYTISNGKRATPLDGLSRLLKNLYGNWEEHDPSQVVVPYSTKIRKRKVRWAGRG